MVIIKHLSLIFVGVAALKHQQGREKHDLYGSSSSLPKRRYTEKTPGHVFITQWVELESAEEENNVLKKIMDEIKPPAKIPRPEVPEVWKIKDEFVLEDGDYVPPEKNRFYEYAEIREFKAHGVFDPVTNIYICKDYDRLNYIAVRLIDKEWFLEEEKKNTSEYYPNMFWGLVLKRVMNKIVRENELPDALVYTYETNYFNSGKKLIIPTEM